MSTGRVTRRELINLTGPQFVAVSVLLQNCIAYARTPSGRIDWSVFIDLISELAGDGMIEASHQDVYVRRVAEVFKRLNLQDTFVRSALRIAQDKVLLSPEYAALHHGAAFEVVSIVFDEGETIPHHDHPDMTGVTGCISGNLVITNYERANNATGSEATLLLNEISTQNLTAGHVSMLTAARANIHSLKALEQTQIVDVFTPPYNSDRAQRTHLYRVETQPISTGGKLFRATVLS